MSRYTFKSYWSLTHHLPFWWLRQSSWLQDYVERNGVAEASIAKYMADMLASLASLFPCARLKYFLPAKASPSVVFRLCYWYLPRAVPSLVVIHVFSIQSLPSCRSQYPILENYEGHPLAPVEMSREVIYAKLYWQMTVYIHDDHFYNNLSLANFEVAKIIRNIEAMKK